MKIIPVIDILNNVAVHGIRGERKRYKPLESILFKNVNPIQIASVFEILGFDTLYVADLDAILEDSPNFEVYRQICNKTKLNLMVDAGISDLFRAEQLIDIGISKIVIGTETLKNLDFVKQAVDTFGKEKVVVSIDQKRGTILTISKSLSNIDFFSAARTIVNLGVKQIIDLDLDRVGTEHGINKEEIRKILETIQVDLLVGGGIRNLNELQELETLGIYGVLVATVLHNGKLAIDDLRSAGFL